MNLSQYQILAGGEGSGCHGPNCGRKAGFGHFPTVPAPRRSATIPERTNLTKSDLAKLHYVSSNYEEQKIADQAEQDLSNLLNMPRTADNRPFDLQNERYGIEIKTLIKNGNDKITMKRDAMERKASEARRMKLKPYTLVIDKRNPAVTTYYVREGFGSFRISSMTKIDTPRGLKRIFK